jgi:Peptidase family M50.
LLFLEPASFFVLGVLLSAFLHVFGHILVYCVFLRRFPVIEVTMTGFCIRIVRSGPGPFTGLALLAWLLQARRSISCWQASGALRLEQVLTIRVSAFWSANLLTGGFNLLPVPPLDGAQLASCLCEMRRAGKKFKGND